MSTPRCPLCRKRYPQSFLAQHASSCSLPPAGVQKKPRSRKGLLLAPLRAPKLTSPTEAGAPGFHVFLGAIPAAQQRALLAALEATPPAWVDYRFRCTKSYGPAYDLPRRRFLFGAGAPAATPLPPYAPPVLARVRDLHPAVGAFQPNQLAVGRYFVPGGHILPHNDCENGDIRTAVVGVCLGGACTMTLILRGRDSGNARDVKRDVLLPPGAVYIMSGEALRTWHHAIFPGKTQRTRTSLTFRDVFPPTESQVLPRSPAPKKRFTQSRLS